MQKIVKLNQAFLYCCMVVMFCLHSISYAAPTQGKPVSINIKNSTLAEVLRQVSKKSGLYIYFQDADLAAHKNVTIDVRNKPVENVLHELLDGRGLSWVEVSENTIAVKKKLEAEERRIEGDTVATITVTGKVVDEKGEPVIGATVLVKGSRIGTTTNPSGDFVLNAIRPNAALVISNVSYLTEELVVRGRNRLGSITLKGYVGKLDEAVVIAYGETSQRFNIGNAITVSAEDIAKQPISNPLLALQDRVPGLVVTQTSGIPGAVPKVQIRGRNSINSGSNIYIQPEPLYIIDGIPVNSEIPGGPVSLGNGSGMASGLSFINVGDIESISVLKDASQTAIYGSRGSNGVILITTKKGKSGPPRININISQGIAKVASKIKLLNRREYLDMRYEAFKNDNLIPSSDPNSGLAYASDLTVWDTTRYTDWQKELLGKTAEYTNAQFSVTGGTSTNQYILGAGFQRQTAVTPGDFSDIKGSIHLGLNGKNENEKFYYSIKTTYLVDNNTLPAIDFTVTALQLAPVAPPLYNEDGSLNWANGTWTPNQPVSRIYEPYEFKNNSFTTNALLGYKVSDFDIKISGGYNIIQGNSYKASPFIAKNPSTWRNARRRADFKNTKFNSWIIEPQITYNKVFNNVKLSSLIGATIQQNHNYFQATSAVGAQSDDLIKSIGAHTSSTTVNSNSDYKYAALFAKVGVNISNRYILDMSARRDGSSRFGPDKQFGNFGSIGAGWIFSEEAYVKDKLSWLSFGKLRASYGTTGGDAIGDYQYMELYTQTFNNYQGAKGLISSGIFNNRYAWESTNKAEIGIEIGLLKDRIFITSSYYRNRSSNQLINYPYPSIVGYGSAITNLPALIQNSGLEVTLNTNNIRKSNLQWNTSFNISLNRNKLIKYPTLQNTPLATSYVIGKPIDGFLQVYHMIGIDPQTGTYLFEDKDGKPTSTPNFDTDRKSYLFLTPKYFGGMQNSIMYKNFTLDISLQFVKQIGKSNLYSYAIPGTLSNMPVEVLDHWRRPGDDAKFERFNADYSLATSQAFAAESDRNYTDASFVRVKNISLMYDVKYLQRSKTSFKDLKIFIQCQNLFTITKYKGYDPETQSNESMPPLKVISFGINAVL